MEEEEEEEEVEKRLQLLLKLECFQLKQVLSPHKLQVQRDSHKLHRIQAPC